MHKKQNMFLPYPALNNDVIPADPAGTVYNDMFDIDENIEDDFLK